MISTTTTTTVTTPSAGSNVAVAFPYRFIEEEHLQVYRVTSAGVRTTLTEGVDYSVTGVDDDAGGSLTITTVTAGDSIVVAREVDITQQQDYVTNDRFPAAGTEKQLDKQIMIDQQLQGGLNRAIKVLPGEPNPAVSARADREETIPVWDSNGDYTEDTPAQLLSRLPLPTGTLSGVGMKTWADDAAKAHADYKPDFNGQLGIQLDTLRVYRATGVTAGDWESIEGHAVLDDDADRAATSPDYVGQLAVQLDTGSTYRATGVTAGDWLRPGSTTVHIVLDPTRPTLSGDGSPTNPYNAYTSTILSGAVNTVLPLQTLLEDVAYTPKGSSVHIGPGTYLVNARATFDATKLGITDWASSTRYEVGDEVISGSTAYACFLAHTSSSGVFSDDGSTNWQAYSRLNGIELIKNIQILGSGVDGTIIKLADTVIAGTDGSSGVTSKKVMGLGFNKQSRTNHKIKVADLTLDANMRGQTTDTTFFRVGGLSSSCLDLVLDNIDVIDCGKTADNSSEGFWVYVVNTGIGTEARARLTNVKVYQESTRFGVPPGGATAFHIGGNSEAGNGSAGHGFVNGSVDGCTAIKSTRGVAFGLGGVNQGLDIINCLIDANAPSWVTNKTYVVNDVVTLDTDGKLYKCDEDHVSGVHATDLAALKWTQFNQATVAFLHDTYLARNVRVSNCTINGCRGSTPVITGSEQDGNQITFSNCIFNQTGTALSVSHMIRVGRYGTTTTGHNGGATHVTIRGCHFKTTLTSTVENITQLYTGAKVTMQHNIADGSILSKWSRAIYPYRKTELVSNTLTLEDPMVNIDVVYEDFNSGRNSVPQYQTEGAKQVTAANVTTTAIDYVGQYLITTDTHAIYQSSGLVPATDWDSVNVFDYLQNIVGEGSAPDTLDTIANSDGFANGAVLRIGPWGGADITISNASATNIVLTGASPYQMTGTEYLVLRHDGTNWNEVTRG